MGQCTAKSKRSKERCQNWAIRKKNTCRFHGGGSTGPRTKEGQEKSRLAHLKHGFRTKENMQQIKSVRALIKTSISYIKNFY